MQLRRQHVVSLVFIGFFYFLILPFSAQAATLFFSPSTAIKQVGDNFTVAVKVNTEGQAINAVQGSIIFDPAKLSVAGISKTGSIFNLWTSDPTFSNSDGTIDFEGGLPSPGYNGSGGLILTVTFKAKAPTTESTDTEAVLSSGSILANDGQGTNVLSSLGKISVVINASQISSTPPPDTSTSGAPVVDSSTHPDSTKWYSNNNPVFAWALPADATGVSYLITDKPTSNPGPKSDGVASQAAFTGIGDGTQYFHIKFQQGGAWGLIAHYQFNIDTAPPAGFDIHTASSSDTQPQITFETTDALSGIDHYEIKVGDSGNWITVSADQAGKPYGLSSDKIGNQTVYVKAIDKAGNATTESIALTIAGSAAGSTIGIWVAKLFDGIVNGLSNYGLLIALLAAIVGILILIYQLLGANLDKLWHRLDDRRVVRKTEHKADSTLDKLMNDMADEIKFLNTIGKHRRLGSEEKYLKSKIEQYLKTLKNSGR